MTVLLRPLLFSGPRVDCNGVAVDEHNFCDWSYQSVTVDVATESYAEILFCLTRLSVWEVFTVYEYRPNLTYTWKSHKAFINSPRIESEQIFQNRDPACHCFTVIRRLSYKKSTLITCNVARITLILCERNVKAFGLCSNVLFCPYILSVLVQITIDGFCFVIKDRAVKYRRRGSKTPCLKSWHESTGHVVREAFCSIHWVPERKVLPRLCSEWNPSHASPGSYCLIRQNRFAFNCKHIVWLSSIWSTIG
jgi:hypothetical protein